MHYMLICTIWTNFGGGGGNVCNFFKCSKKGKKKKRFEMHIKCQTEAESDE